MSIKGEGSRKQRQIKKRKKLNGGANAPEGALHAVPKKTTRV